MKELKAVALKYPESAEAPFISAVGKGLAAEKILEIAKEHSIPVVENEIAADVLSVQEIGSMIPENTWEIVAQIFSVVVKYEKM